MSAFIDRTGQRFSRLLVLCCDGQKNGKTLWMCQCDCGRTTRVATDKLASGHTRSCGCLSIDRIRLLKFRHGENRVNHRTTEYRAWVNMKLRCSNPRANGYQHYGGRGIRVCEEWEVSFEAFLRDMGRCPPGYSLDRINTDGNYEQRNCRWSTPRDQMRNTRRNRLITIDGQTACLQDWALASGHDRMVITHRLNAGWSARDAVMTPLRHRRPSPCPEPTP